MNVDEKCPSEAVLAIEVINLQDCEKWQSSTLGEFESFEVEAKNRRGVQVGVSRQYESVESCLLR